MADSASDPNSCDGPSVDVGMRSLRVASIFIIFVAAMIGAMAPVILARQRLFAVPKFTFFIFKYIGTGIIIATAFIHLVDPAVEQLGNPCVKEKWLGDFPWAECIMLIMVMSLFCGELVVGWVEKSRAGPDNGFDVDELLGMTASHGHSEDKNETRVKECSKDVESQNGSARASLVNGFLPGQVPDQNGRPPPPVDQGQKSLTTQLTAIFILEFGVVFHSVLIGLMLATTSQNGIQALVVALVFHQLFEGLGLGARIATASWPSNRKWVPYVLACGFALSTPIGLAVGLETKPATSATQNLVGGIFDSVSAGILIYTGLVELLGHEFMFNPSMRRAPIKIQLLGFGCIIFGVVVMTILGKWT